MAEAEQNSNAKLSEVSSKLSTLNKSQDTGLGNIKSLTETLVSQGQSAADSADAVARVTRENQREAARARKDKAGAQDVNVLNWQKNEEGSGLMGGLMDFFGQRFAFKGLKGFSLGGLFAKGGITKMLAALGTTIFAGVKTAFAGIGAKFTALLGPTLLKFMGPAAIVAGLVMALKSGFDGAMNAMDWGVSKISGFLGGFFAGEADGGIKNMFKNAGKWAMIGAGLGSVVPVIGTLVGGLVGAAIGGILGLIGAKKVAAAFDKIGAWFKSAWQGITNFMSEVWDKVVTWFKELWSFDYGAAISEGWTNLSAYVGGVWNDIVGWFKTVFTFLGVDTAWTSLTGFVSEKWAQVKKWFEDLLTFEGDGGEKIGIGEKIIQLFAKIPDKIVALFEKIVQSVKDIFNSISLPTWLGGKEKPDPKEVAKKRADLQLQMSITKGRKTEEASVTNLWRGFSEEDRAKKIAEIQKELAALPQIATGGPILETGPAVVHKGELMMDNNAATMMLRSAELLSRLEYQNWMAKSETTNTAAPPMIVNNNNQSSVRTSNTPMMAMSPPINPHTRNQLPGTA